MIKVRELRIVAISLVLFALTACISAKPIETQSTVDDRPLLFFVADGNASHSDGSEIFVDGLLMGKASSFVNTKKGLAIIPGTHLVEVRRNGAILVKEKIYVGSGTNKTIPINLSTH